MSAVTDVLARYPRAPSEAVHEWTPGSIATIRSGILFVLATWSGPSISLLLRLRAHLATRGSELLVCDIDLLPWTERAALADLHGRGEAFWIVRGRVVAALSGPVSDDGLSVAVERNNRLLEAERRG